jgi:hypothetical protein
MKINDVTNVTRFAANNKLNILPSNGPPLRHRRLAAPKLARANAGVQNRSQSH